MRAFVFRASPLLLLAAALLPALLLFHDVPPSAWAQDRTIPTVPRNVMVAPGDAALTLTWEAPSAWGSFPAGGYEVDWYAGASPPTDSEDWKEATGANSPLAATATSYTFTGAYGDHTVANGTTYQLRVRAFTVNPNDDTDPLPSHWVVVSGTPGVLSFGFERGEYLVKENVDSFVLAVESGQEVAADATITIKATDGTSTPSDSAANRGTDYGGDATFTVTMTAESNRTEFTQKIIDDNVLEPSEKFTLTIASVSSGVVGDQDTAVVTIQDNDVGVEFESTAYAAKEGQSTLTVKVVTTQGSDLSSDFPLTVGYTSLGATAGTACGSDPNADHVTAPSSVNFLSNQTQKEFTITICDNGDYRDYDESFRLTLQTPGPERARIFLGDRSSATVTIRDDDHSHGLSPGLPSLEAATSPNEPTATTLSVNVSCVDRGSTWVTDFVLRAVNKDDPTDSHVRYLPPDWSCQTDNGLSVLRTMEDLPSRPTATTYRVQARARNLFARISPWSDWVEVTTPAGQQQVIGQAPCTGCGTEGDRGVIYNAPSRYAELFVKMKEWRNDPQWVSDKAHTDRWDRALLAFGETVEDTTLTPMTAAEAQALADQSWGARWVPVAKALWELENRAPTVSSAIADATIVNASGTRTVSLSGVFSDADNDALTVTAASSDEAKATVSVAADYATLTVNAQTRGTATITVTANDGKGGTVEDSFTVTVKAAPVVASAVSDMDLKAEATRDVSLSGVFSDPDGDALTITAETSDPGVVEARIVQDTLTIAGVADGTATVTVTARDADGNTVSDTLDVTVVGPPTPVSNLSCDAKTDRVTFRWDAPQWSGAEVYVYDYVVGLPDGTWDLVRLRGYPVVSEKGAYEAGKKASISIKAVYELADGSEVSSSLETLTCIVAE